MRQLFKNIIYVGACSALLNIDRDVIIGLLNDQFPGKEKVVASNVKALDLGIEYAKEHWNCPLSFHASPLDLTKGKIMVDGNTACGLGAVYGGATVMAWYPITPSTSVADAFEQYCSELRVDKETGKHKYAIIQAEDELAAIGVVIGANWNGARAFTATSGPGVSLMNEFLGLAIRPVVHRLGDKPTFLLGLGCAAVGLIGATLAPTVGLFTVALVPLALGMQGDARALPLLRSGDGGGGR